MGTDRVFAPAAVADGDGNLWIAFEDEGVVRGGFSVPGVSVFRSADGGHSWSEAFDIGLAGGELGYPDLAYADGHVFLAYVDHTNARIGVARIPQTADTTALMTSFPSLPIGGAPRSVRIASDAEAGDDGGALYLSYALEGMGGADLFVSVSVPGALGAAWTPAVALGTAGLGPFDGYYPVHGMGASPSAVHVTFVDAASGALSVRTSTDGAVTFSDPAAVGPAAFRYFSLDIAAFGEEALVAFSYLTNDGSVQDLDVAAFYTDDAGAAWDPVGVDEGAGNAGASTVDHDGTGAFYVGFVRGDSEFANANAMRATVIAGNLINAPTLVSTAAAADAVAFEVAAVVGRPDGEGTAAAYVVSDIGAADGVYASPLTGEPPPPGPPSLAAMDVDLLGVYRGSAVWGDYDGDGDLDIAVAGWATSGWDAKVYRNDAGTFADAGLSLARTASGAPTIAATTSRTTRAEPRKTAARRTAAVPSGGADQKATPRRASRVATASTRSAGADAPVGGGGRTSSGNEEGALLWGDPDADGDLDLVIAGYDASYNPIFRLYRNDAGAFADAGAAFAPLTDNPALAWVDYDSDGDDDLVAVGVNADGYDAADLYRNDAGTFTQVANQLGSVRSGVVAAADYDSDGDDDLLVAGSQGGYVQWARLYRNDGGAFVNSGTDLSWGWGGSASWGDYDSDGDPDLLITGGSYSVSTRLYQNDGGVLTEVATGLTDISRGAAAWGDYDADGDPDLILGGDTGYHTPGNLLVFTNEGGTFTDADAGLPGFDDASAAWGDYDGDGDLDLLAAGTDTTGSYTTSLFQSSGGPVNMPPAVPSGLAATATDSSATLSWAPSTDDSTPTPALTYAVRLGTSPGRGDVFLALALPDGHRLVPRHGNVGTRTSLAVSDLEPGTYYWSVQAVDAAFAGSPFAAEQHLVVGSGGGVDLVVTPAGPVTVAPGDTLEFSYTLTNASGAPVTGGLWYTADRDGTTAAEGVITAGGTIPDGTTVTGSFTQLVPTSAPTGDYDYAVKFGTFPSTVVDSEAFVVTVTSGGARIGVAARSTERRSTTGDAWLVLRAAPWTVMEAIATGPEVSTRADLPGALTLGAPFPNPAQARVSLPFGLPERGSVRLAVYDVLGREVVRVVDEEIEAGWHRAELDGAMLPSGVYVVRLVAEGASRTRRVTLVK